MKRILPGLVLASLLLASCASVKPPKRPVAYLFPTMTTMQMVRLMQARPCTPEQVASVLDALDDQQHFRRAGLLADDLAILARGLTSRGYAELDARRTDCPFQWATFSLLPEGGLVVRLSLPGKPSDWNPPKDAAYQTEADPYGCSPQRFLVIPAPPKAGAEAFYRHLVTDPKKDAWEAIYLFPLWPPQES